MMTDLLEKMSWSDAAGQIWLTSSSTSTTASYPAPDILPRAFLFSRKYSDLLE